MYRPKTTPRVWHSEDKSLTFRMDENGITDICPGPNSKLMKYLRNEITDSQYRLMYPRKFATKQTQHIHWAQNLE